MKEHVLYKVIGQPFTGDKDYDSIDILNADEINSIKSVKDHNGKSWLLVSYIDPELLIATTLICTELQKV